jgi:hypothetical protein
MRCMRKGSRLLYPVGVNQLMNTGVDQDYYAVLVHSKYGDDTVPPFNISPNLSLK